jgi:hypothetical protein
MTFQIQRWNQIWTVKSMLGGDQRSLSCYVFIHGIRDDGDYLISNNVWGFFLWRDVFTRFCGREQVDDDTMKKRNITLARKLVVWWITQHVISYTDIHNHSSSKSDILLTDHMSIFLSSEIDDHLSFLKLSCTALLPHQTKLEAVYMKWCYSMNGLKKIPPPF